VTAASAGPSSVGRPSSAYTAPDSPRVRAWRRSRATTAGGRRARAGRAALVDHRRDRGGVEAVQVELEHDAGTVREKAAVAGDGAAAPASAASFTVRPVDGDRGGHGAVLDACASWSSASVGAHDSRSIVPSASALASRRSRRRASAPRTGRGRRPAREPGRCAPRRPCRAWSAATADAVEPAGTATPAVRSTSRSAIPAPVDRTCTLARSPMEWSGHPQVPGVHSG
jgi:hypothetical protein